MPITAREVRVEDRQGKPILQDVQLTIPDAGITLIVGRNGAGKSTLLDALSGLTEWRQGVVHYDDVPLWHAGKQGEDGRKRRGKRKKPNPDALRQIGNVFQYPEQQLFAQTVEREFAFSLEFLKLSHSEIAERARQAMDRVRLPDTLLDESPHQLSGGQKRRVALASTMAVRPKWLMLDEPTAGLDADGTAAFIEWLEEQQREGCGIIIATHDLDTLLPLADHLIVMTNGRVAAELRRSEITGSGHVLREAGLGVPFALALIDELAKTGHGMPLPKRYPEASELAEAIIRAATDRGEATDGDSTKVQNPTDSKTARNQTTKVQYQTNSMSAPKQTTKVQYRSDSEMQSDEGRSFPSMEEGEGLAAIDPRAKWLFCLVISIAILLQDTWLGLAAGGAAAAVVVLLVRGAWRTMLKLSIPFVLFIVISMTVSGLQLAGGVHFTADSSLRTLFELLKIWIVLGIGVGFAASTSQLMMKRALEQSLGGLRRLRLPVDAVALGASLILRFIPVLMKEYRRFARVITARGKQPSRSGGIRPRYMPAMFIPLLISLFQLASDLTTAMQARGLTSFQQKRTSGFKLEMTGKDWFVVLLGGVVFAGFLLADRFVFD